MNCHVDTHLSRLFVAPGFCIHRLLSFAQEDLPTSSIIWAFGGIRAYATAIVCYLEGVVVEAVDRHLIWPSECMKDGILLVAVTILFFVAVVAAYVQRDW